jgi:hypothetical protein
MQATRGELECGGTTGLRQRSFHMARRKGGGVTASYGSVFPRPGDHIRKEEEREKADLWVLSCKGGASI